MDQVNGVWTKKISLVTGTHDYKFIVDDKWVYDVSLPNKTDNEGNINNVIYVEESFKEGKKFTKDPVNIGKTAPPVKKKVVKDSPDHSHSTKSDVSRNRIAKKEDSPPPLIPPDDSNIFNLIEELEKDKVGSHKQSKGIQDIRSPNNSQSKLSQDKPHSLQPKISQDKSRSPQSKISQDKVHSPKQSKVVGDKSDTPGKKQSQVTEQVPNKSQSKITQDKAHEPNQSKAVEDKPNSPQSKISQGKPHSPQPKISQDKPHSPQSKISQDKTDSSNQSKPVIQNQPKAVEDKSQSPNQPQKSTLSTKNAEKSISTNDPNHSAIKKEEPNVKVYCYTCNIELIADKTANSNQLKSGVARPICYTCALKQKYFRENQSLNDKAKNINKKTNN